MGTGYAVWTGIGAVGTALVGIVMLGEPKDAGAEAGEPALTSLVTLSGAKGSISGMAPFTSFRVTRSVW